MCHSHSATEHVFAGEESHYNITTQCYILIFTHQGPLGNVGDLSVPWDGRKLILSQPRVQYASQPICHVLIHQMKLVLFYNHVHIN